MKKPLYIVSVIVCLILGYMVASMNSTPRLSAEESKALGRSFLIDNGRKPNIVTTKSGLQYEILDKGVGKKPKASDQVTVHYQGTTVDGHEFDSSYKRGEPATFPLNRVIAGWTEGLQLMKEGARYRFFIPSELGYGERGAGRDIPAHAALIFEVELVKVN